MEWFPWLLRATFEPMVLSPRIWANLLRGQAWAPWLLTTLNRPRLLSPDIDLQLLHMFPQITVLSHQYRDSVRVHGKYTAHTVSSSGAQSYHPAGPAVNIPDNSGPIKDMGNSTVCPDKPEGVFTI